MEWYEIQYSPYRQLVLVLIILVLLTLYYNASFKNEDYNKLCLVYAIFIALWLGTIVVRYLFLSYYPRPRNHSYIFEIPYGMKCYFGEKDCEGGNFDIFSIIHIVAYIIIGYLVPGYYFEILVISVACELLEYTMSGFQAKYLLDPAINLFGYFIGTQLSYIND
jgi:hypothetical protein